MKCLVVGQGIAGTVLAWLLLQRGVSVRVCDPGFPHQSSSLAAGIINPVTGKRFVKTWRLDEFFPVARATYQAMESDLACALWHEQPIIRLLNSPQEINDWSARIGTPGYNHLLGEREHAGEWAPFLKPGFYVGEIRQAARVDFPTLMAAFRHRMQEAHLFSAEQTTPEAAGAKSDAFDYIIFCEGYRGKQNVYFPGLAWQLSKGEGMLLRIDNPGGALPRDMLKRDLMLVPLGQGLYWAGASYNWTFEDEGPTGVEQQYLESRLANMLEAPYTVVRRFGAIRPTIKDRRPLLGISPKDPKMVIFNGLGTKGALLAPFWANHLAEHLLEGKPLDPEVDIQRFF